MFAKIYLEITNVCNMNCSFCVGTARNKRFLTTDQFYLLAEKLRPHTDFLYLHLMGEPTIHPKLSEILKSAEALGFKVILTTNGTNLSKVADILLESQTLFKVSISLHSFEANDKTNADEYFDSCFDFADRASKKGVISVFRLWNDGGLNSLNDQILLKLKERFPNDEWSQNTKGIRIRKKLFIENGEKFEWPLHSKIVTDSISCYGMRDHVGVLCDGSVVPCCMDYDGNAVLGNLFESSLDKILASEKALNFKKMLENGVAPCEMCRSCGFAQKKFLHV